MADPSGGMTVVQDPKKPIGGHVLAHASTVRLSLRKVLLADHRACQVEHVIVVTVIVAVNHHFIVHRGSGSRRAASYQGGRPSVHAYVMLDLKPAFLVLCEA